MRKPIFLALLAVLSTLLTSCGSSNNAIGGCGGQCPVSAAPVSLTMTDDPPSGVTVLFFQVSLTAASIQPTSGSPVSLLNNTPIQIDVTQLQALSAFLASANVPPGTYSSLSLTFANPQLVILNQADTALAGSCAVGSICTLTPAIDNSAAVNFTSAPFPVTVSANSPLGFLVDFHLNTVIQSDLSVNLGVANGITLAQVPPSASSTPPPFGFLIGTITTVTPSTNQFMLQTPSGQTFIIDASSAALADWPPCPSPGGISCLGPGDIVKVQIASVETGGILKAATVTWLQLQSQNQQVVEGTVVGFNGAQVKVILQDLFLSPNAAPLGGVATVTLDQGAAFSVDSGGFAIPSGFVFSGFSNLAFGQQLQLAVDSGSMSCATSNAITAGGWGPPAFCTFSTNNVQLEPSQLSGLILSIDSSASSFTLGNFPSITFDPVGSIPAGIAVNTTSQTTYQGFSPDNFAGLANNDFVSVNGWLFENDNGILDPAITPPVVLAQNVTQHPSGVF